MHDLLISPINLDAARVASGCHARRGVAFLVAVAASAGRAHLTPQLLGEPWLVTTDRLTDIGGKATHV